jgi:hypothetical protein
VLVDFSPAKSAFTENGVLEIDNNTSERTLRLCAIGRKNWMFVGSDRGGETAAICFSIRANAKRYRIEPFAYVRALLIALSSEEVAWSRSCPTSGSLRTRSRPHVPSRRVRGRREHSTMTSCHPPREDPRAHSEPLTGATLVSRLAISGTSSRGPPARIIRSQRPRTQVRAWSIRRHRAEAIACADVALAVRARHPCRRG